MILSNIFLKEGLSSNIPKNKGYKMRYKQKGKNNYRLLKTSGLKEKRPVCTCRLIKSRREKSINEILMHNQNIKALDGV